MSVYCCLYRISSLDLNFIIAKCDVGSSSSCSSSNNNNDSSNRRRTKQQQQQRQQQLLMSRQWLPHLPRVAPKTTAGSTTDCQFSNPQSCAAPSLSSLCGNGQLATGNNSQIT
ncbi:hypothetical protein ACLKA6_005852 [Drosophila palustris]